ncbi:MAG: hypothetical protein ACRDP3_09760 [Streptomyces sp.]|uniref:hypothetical protein n=1 Tax=Streptomyces sp. TaxID=1931 RepID=UPI003D6B97F1
MGKGSGQRPGWAQAPHGHGGTPYGTPGAGASYVPPQQVLPPDGEYGPDPHGRKGPQQGRRARKVTGVIAASSIFVAALVQIAIVVFVDDSSGPPDRTYTVSLPPLLEDGKLTLTRDFSDEPGLALRGESEESTGRGLVPVAGHYEGTSKAAGAENDKASDQLTVRGYNGSTVRPESTVHDLLGTLEGDEASGGERRRITPSGTDEPLTCEIMLKDKGEDVVEAPVCAWRNNGSFVAVVDRGPSVRGSYGSDLDAFAERVDALRTELRAKAAGSGS